LPVLVSITGLAVLVDLTQVFGSSYRYITQFSSLLQPLLSFRYLNPYIGIYNYLLNSCPIQK
ncbi:MAG: hypothetical protein AAGF83_05860, partial [Cyanobacteria bacterium P01_G01_bin.67]